MADLLVFYAALAEIQETLPQRYSNAIIGGSARFADRLDPGALLRALPPLLRDISTHAPEAWHERVPALGEHDHDRWRHRIQSCWITGGREAWDADEIQRFVLELLLQPFAEVVASAQAAEGTGVPGVPGVPGGPQVPGEPETPDASGVRCPQCTGEPVVALLREHGHGARRSLVCGFCLTEWPSLRLVCLGCGESRFEALPVFRAEELDAVRLDACESCRTYAKTIDLTRDGRASAIVDDLASLPLDLWARERGYRRGRPNLLRL